jgi:hypothetical protein
MRNTIISLYQSSHLASLVPTTQRIIERAAVAIAAYPEPRKKIQ